MAEDDYDISDFEEALGTPGRTPPVAVVRRTGESRVGMKLRHAGYSDEQLYGGGNGALGRSAALSLQSRRLDDAAAAVASRDALAQKKYDLDQRKYDLDKRVHDQAMEDTMAVHDQGAGLLTDIQDVAGRFARGTKEFYQNALPLFAKYPRAVDSNPRIGEMYKDYERGLNQFGSSPEEATALWELGQFNPAPDEEKGYDPMAYLATIPGKYPNAAASKQFQDAFKLAQQRATPKKDTTLQFETADEAADYFGPDYSIRRGTKGWTGTRAAKTIAPGEQARIDLEREKMKAAAAKGGQRRVVTVYDKDGKIVESSETKLVPPDAAPSATPTATPAATPSAMPDDVAASARAAIAAGKDPDAVKARLKEKGFDPSGL